MLRLSESVRCDQGEDRRGVREEGGLLRLLPHLAPGYGFLDLCAAQAAVILDGGGYVARVVESALELVPPKRVMLGNASSYNQGPALLRVEDDVGQAFLVLYHVDPEIGAPVGEKPDLRSHGSVHGARNENWHALLLGPIEKALLVVQHPAEAYAE